MMPNGLITFCSCFQRSVEEALRHPGGCAQPGLCSYSQVIFCCLGWKNVIDVCQRESAIPSQYNYNDTITQGSQAISSASQRSNSRQEMTEEVFILAILVLFCIFHKKFILVVKTPFTKTICVRKPELAFLGP